MARWILLTDKYEGVTKNAVNMLYSYISAKLSYVLIAKKLEDAQKSDFENNNIIVVAKSDSEIVCDCIDRGLMNVPSQKEGYGVYVGQSIFSEQNQMIVISASAENGILYGCTEFLGTYCGEKLLNKNGDNCADSFYENIFDKNLPSFSLSAHPKIKTRAIWTWGHVIYDYRAFFENMAKLRLNEVVIWNDTLPINAAEVTEYAHSYGIKVIWGFAWGWDNEAHKMHKNIEPEALQKIKESVVNTYKSQYQNCGCDGIYFQSFTEMREDYINGKCVAEIVTDLVNETANELFKITPDLHIQFGLHATSVKNHLDILKRVDERIYIVWEDCGAFPFDYRADRIDGFEEAYKLTERLISLREKERFGAVLKGLLKLDWSQFEHISGRFILGERMGEFIRERSEMKNRIWRGVQANWLKNAEYCRKIVSLISKNENCPIVEALVEDSMFENEIMLPVALYAEILWNPEEPIGDIISSVAQKPFVKFAN